MSSRQILAVDQLHDEGRHAAGFFEPVDRRNIRMIQRGEHFGFALEACDPIRIGRDRRRQNLDGDIALQLGIRRAIDLAHPACANWHGDFIDAEARAGGESQRVTSRVRLS